MLAELIDEIREKYPKVDQMATAHNLGTGSLVLPAMVIEQVQEAIRDEYGDVIELYHGSPINLVDLNWREGSSFTNEFDLEFAGEDGYIVVAQVPVERIKFYLDSENEFVVTAGKLNCEVYTVAEYFGL
jgi:hypothetical protein